MRLIVDGPVAAHGAAGLVLELRRDDLSALRRSIVEAAELLHGNFQAATGWGAEETKELFLRIRDALSNDERDLRFPMTTDEAHFLGLCLEYCMAGMRDGDFASRVGMQRPGEVIARLFDVPPEARVSIGRVPSHATVWRAKQQLGRFLPDETRHPMRITVPEPMMVLRPGLLPEARAIARAIGVAAGGLAASIDRDPHAHVEPILTSRLDADDPSFGHIAAEVVALSLTWTATMVGRDGAYETPRWITFMQIAMGPFGDRWGVSQFFTRGLLSAVEVRAFAALEARGAGPRLLAQEGVPLRRG